MSARQRDPIQDIADLWERANDAVDDGMCGGQIAPNVQRLVDDWLGEDDVSLADFVEFLSRRAILAAQEAAA